MLTMLTEKQEAFVQAYLETGNATASYKRAYSSNAQPAAINVSACRLLKNAKVQERISSLQAKVQAKVDAKIAEAVASVTGGAQIEAALTMEAHLKRLADLARQAEADKKWSAAVAAEVKRGEVMGYYVNRTVSVNHNYAISDKPVDDPDAWADQFAAEHSAEN